MNRIQLFRALLEAGVETDEAKKLANQASDELIAKGDLDEIFESLGIEVEDEEEEDVEDEDGDEEEEEEEADPRDARVAQPRHRPVPAARPAVSQGASQRAAELSARATVGAQPVVDGNAHDSAVKEPGSDAQLNPLAKAWQSLKTAMSAQTSKTDKKWFIGALVATVILISVGCVVLSSFVLAMWPTAENMSTPVAVYETPTSSDGGFVIPFETADPAVIVDAFGVSGEPEAQATMVPTEVPTPPPADWWKTSDEEVASVFDLADILRKPSTFEGWWMNPNLGLLGFLIVLPLAILAKVGHDAERRKESDARIAFGMVAVMALSMVIAEAVTIGGQLSGVNPGETAVWFVRLGVVVSITGAVVAAMLGQTDLTAATAVVFIDGLLIFGWYGSAGPMWLLSGYGLMMLGAGGELIELYLENRLKSGILVGSLIGLAFYLFMVVAVIIGSALTTMAPWPSVLVYVQTIMIYLAVKGGPLAAIIFAMIVIYAFGDVIAGALIKATAPGQRKGVSTRREASTLAPNETTAVYDAQILGIMMIAMTLAPIGTFLATIMVAAQ